MADFGRYQLREGERRRGRRRGGEKGEPSAALLSRSVAYRRRNRSRDPSPIGNFFSLRWEKIHLLALGEETSSRVG
ncbi:hypothetical protein B296_00058744 [Ensete ventricosum]|uniref:Uncharacterized protein n=1 Tax=Ensete ventricosum TaxID=4639 RepID=A0A426X2H1_ENSVE|nr:hypothetical protein B296_00058744 [Ensete ventricosum]